MWCYNLLKLSLISAILSACVIQPIYRAGKTAPAQRLFTHIRITAPASGFEQIIDNKLEDLLHGGAAISAYKYTLAVKAKSTYHTNLIALDKAGLDANAQALAGVVEASAAYVLTDGKGRSLCSGEVYSSAPYDRLHQEYANLKARERAQQQAAGELGEQIYLKLAYFLSSST